MSPGLALAGAVEPLFSIADRLGLVDTVKNKLASRPDPAGEKLSEVLEEISKIYEALDQEISRYLSIGTDAESLATPETRSVLVSLEGGAIMARMSAARGHCSKITNLYHRYLRGWFDRVLSRDEAGEMQSLFNALDEFDGVMAGAIDSTARWLTHMAADTMQAIDDGRMADAADQIRSARRQALPTRREIAQLMLHLRGLQADFYQSSGAL